MNIGSWADDLQKPGEGAAADSDDTRYGKVWSDVISKWTYANRRSYRSADVLLLCWEHAVIKPDIERLASVFDLSRARVQCQYLRLKPGQWTQDCLNDHISPFVERCRREKSPLVIVYYAGHGQPGGTFDTSGLLGLDLETYLKKTSLADRESLSASCPEGQQSSSRSGNQLDWDETLRCLSVERPSILGFFDW